MAMIEFDDSEPCYVISIAARKVGVRIQTLRYYERVGVIKPTRSRGNTRLYSEADVERLQRVRRLTEDLGINLAGVEVVLRMAERMAEMQRQIEEMEQEIRRLKQASSLEA